MAVLIPIILTLVFILAITALFQFLRPRREWDPRKDGWYGRSEKLENGGKFPKDDHHVKPFRIQVGQDILEDLKRRLENTRLEEPMEGTTFEYGFNSTYMKEVVEYWKDKYDWRAQEKLLNEYPQYMTQIEGLGIHFMRIRPKVDKNQVKVLPLILLHGWPSTCFEFRKMIPLLTTVRSGQDFVFEVICPSIPGYGFSEAPHREGLDATAAARIFVKLMSRMNYTRFFVHGGDWGSRIACNMARFFPERLLGLHITMCSFGLRKLDALKYIFISMFPSILLPEQRFMAGSKDKIKTLLRESGYFHINATKPETLGCAMSDSPAGVAAYLLEKYSIGTNPVFVYLPDGGLTKKFTLDELLTTVMITWVNNSFTAAARFYKENVKDVIYLISERCHIHVPTGISVFPFEVLTYPLLTVAGQMKNIVSYNILSRGGHFAALEEPELLANELWNFARTVRGLKVDEYYGNCR